MKIFLAGAGGAIGRRLTPLLRGAGHAVAGTTRSKDKAAAIADLGAEPVVVDVFDSEALARAVKAAAPDVLMHQLTDLPFAPGTPRYDEALERNSRLRVAGTRNLADAAKAAGVRRMISQSIAFVYAPASGVRVETDPLDVSAGRRLICRKASCCVTAISTARAPGTWRRSAQSRRCTSTPRPGPRCLP
jgi:nucleoside-diphosphate-sugar epimerase